MESVLTSDAERFVLSLVTVLDAGELELAKEILEPQAAWSRFRSTREPVGYGVEAAIDLFAPYAAIVGAWAFGVVQGEAKEIVEGKLKALTRRALGRRAKAPPVTTLSNPLDLNELESEALRMAIDLSMDPAKAKILAAAIRGRIAKVNE